ncbi:hypothetical protein F3D3_3823 [Fusibacter sp. 3D3]|nr:hypothetical protein F3D3_3823 [Fusibacter sp. 3D3]
MAVIINHTGNVFEYEDTEVTYSKEKHPVKGFLDAKGRYVNLNNVAAISILCR